MVMDYPALPARPADDDAEQCALKVWRLEELFKRLARQWALKIELSPGWPGLALCRQRWTVVRRLELRLQANYLQDGKEFYELRFVETGPGVLGIRVRHDFGCGRLLADEVLSEGRLTRHLEERARLLGLIGRPPGTRRRAMILRRLRESLKFGSLHAGKRRAAPPPKH